MDLLILRGDTKLFEGQVESRVEVNVVLVSLGFGLFTEEDGSYTIKYRNGPISPKYLPEWEFDHILYDALKSGYLSRATDLRFIKIDRYF